MNGRVKIEIVRNDKGIYSHDITSANLNNSSNEELIDRLIEENFRSLSDRIHYEINDNKGNPQLIIKSNMICRDYLKIATKRIVKEYNKEVGRQ